MAGRSKVMLGFLACALAVGGRAPLRAQALDEAVSTPRAAADGHARVRAYAHDLFGVGSWVGVTAGSGLDEVRTDPREWGTGAVGYGRRFASRGGHLVVQETVRHGMAAALGRSTAYVRCDCRDFGGRARNAVVETFTDTDARGVRMFSVPRITGAFAGSFATMLWRPHATAAGAARDGAVGLLFTVTGNLLKEYVHWPS